MMTSKHKNYLGVREMVKSQRRVDEIDTILWTSTDTLEISLSSGQM